MKIYILHEIGAPNHYEGLTFLAKRKNIDIIFREFSILRSFIKSIYFFNFLEFKKAIINLSFLFSLIFTSNKKILVGIAPFDFRMILYVYLFRKHNIFFHTSHTTWMSGKFPKNTFLSRLKITREAWFNFISKSSYCFCVTERSRKELSNFFKIKITKTVFHTSSSIKLNNLIKRERYLISSSINKKTISCFYCGRLVEQKGIRIIVDLAKRLPHIEFKFAGKGNLRRYLVKESKISNNIKILGYLDKVNVGIQYQNSDILLLPSIKTAKWEELFGISLIEAMSYGLIPLTTDHSGPLEIINNKIDGYIFDEKNYSKQAYKLLTNFSSNPKIMKDLKLNAIKKSKKFSIENISKLWTDITYNE